MVDSFVRVQNSRDRMGGFCRGAPRLMKAEGERIDRPL